MTRIACIRRGSNLYLRQHRVRSTRASGWMAATQVCMYVPLPCALPSGRPFRVGQPAGSTVMTKCPLQRTFLGWDIVGRDGRRASRMDGCMPTYVHRLMDGWMQGRHRGLAAEPHACWVRKCGHDHPCTMDVAELIMHTEKEARVG